MVIVTLKDTKIDLSEETYMMISFRDGVWYLINTLEDGANRLVASSDTEGMLIMINGLSAFNNLEGW